jgi:hypothetical protein
LGRRHPDARRLLPLGGGQSCHQANQLIALLYVGIALLGLGVISLGIGLLTA